MEELSRRIIWEANRNYVQNHNEHSDIYGFTVAMNKFADLVSKYSKMNDYSFGLYSVGLCNDYRHTVYTNLCLDFGSHA